MKNSNLFKIEYARQIYQVVIAPSEDTSSSQDLKPMELSVMEDYILVCGMFGIQGKNRCIYIETTHEDWEEKQNPSELWKRNHRVFFIIR